LVEAAPDEKGRGFTLTDGAPPTAPTCYVGAARIRLLPDSVKRKDGMTEFSLEIAIEPRLREAKILSGAAIESALDENGKAIDAGDAPAEPTDLRHVAGILKLGAKQQKLKELVGSVKLEAFTGDKVVVIDQPTKNVGKTADMGDGFTFRLDAADKKDNGDVNVQVTMSKQFQPGGKIVIRGGFADYRPELTDAKGNPYTLASSSTQANFNGRMLTTKWTLTFRPRDKDAEAAELCVHASEERKSQMSVPFSFKDVTLP